MLWKKHLLCSNTDFIFWLYVVFGKSNIWVVLISHTFTLTVLFNCNLHLNIWTLRLTCVVYRLTFRLLVILLGAVLIVTRLSKPWGLQVNANCSPCCLTPVLVTLLNRRTHQIQECPCGASNQENVSFIHELHFPFRQVLFHTRHCTFNIRLIIMLFSSSCSVHSVGRSPRTSCCCTARRLGKDPGFHGQSPEAVNLWFIWR